MELIDTHTHLDFPDFDADRPALLAESRALGVRQMVVLGCIGTTGSGSGTWCKATRTCTPRWACIRFTLTSIATRI